MRSPLKLLLALMMVFGLLGADLPPTQRVLAKGVDATVVDADAKRVCWGTQTGEVWCWNGQHSPHRIAHLSAPVVAIDITGATVWVVAGGLWRLTSHHAKYVAEANSYSHRIATDSTHVYFGDGRVVAWDIEKQSVTVLEPLTDYPDWLAVADGWVYWQVTASDDSTVLRIPRAGGPVEVVIPGNWADDGRGFALEGEKIWSYQPAFGVRTAMLPAATTGTNYVPLDWTVVDPAGTAVWATDGFGCWARGPNLKCQIAGGSPVDLGTVDAIVSATVFREWVVVTVDTDIFTDDGGGKVIALPLRQL